jgi:hypothetical protein
MQSSPPQMNSAAESVLQILRDTVQGYTTGDVTASAMVSAFREHTPALELPEAFPRVLEELLRRLEMADVFLQDSCSFSSTGIQEQLGLWLDKAQAHVRKRAG